MEKSKLIYDVGMMLSKKEIMKRHGKDFYTDFRRLALPVANDVIAKMPDIGNTMFAVNFLFAPTYISWYKASKALGLSPEETQKMLWLVNERMLALIPKRLARLYLKPAIHSSKKKALEHVRLQQEKRLHPYDWKIKYTEVDDTSYETEIYECGFIKLAKDFDVPGIVPAICRVDYLMSNLMGIGFVRTKTLGDGDACCNGRYFLGGSTEWAPEKGFIDRK
jgi:hypothetical protein